MPVLLLLARSSSVMVQAKTGDMLRFAAWGEASAVWQNHSNPLVLLLQAKQPCDSVLSQPDWSNLQPWKLQVGLQRKVSLWMDSRHEVFFWRNYDEACHPWKPSEEIHLMHCIASDGQNGTIEELNELLSLQAAFQCKRCPMFNLWKSGVFPFFRLQVQDLTVICTHHNDCSSIHTVWVSKLIFKRWIWKRSMKST